MKKQFLFLAMCIVTILSVNAQTSVWDGSHTTWTKGTGTQANPYLIENAAQLAHLAYVVNNGIGSDSKGVVGADIYWRLMTDIDLNSKQWTPIGNLDYSRTIIVSNFGGHFDGNNHTIANLYNENTDYAGLFGNVESGSIKNVGIVSGKIETGSWGIGAIAGYAKNAVIDNCYNEINITSLYNTGWGPAGGIVGQAFNTTINNCYNTGDISLTSRAGGITGLSDACRINDCYNTGNISASSSQNNAYSGGITSSGPDTTINNCYNTGSINGNYKGGIIAENNNTTVTNSHYLSICGGAGAGQSQTVEFMKTAEFVTLLNAGSSTYIQDIVPYVNGGYPILIQQSLLIQFFPVTNITQARATVNCSLKINNVNVIITAKQLICNNQTINLTSTDNLLTHTISGLTPNTTYSYTFRLISSDNDTCKATSAFTTLPINIATHNATNVTQTKTTLNGEINSGDATVTKGFEYKLSTETNYESVNVNGSGSNITYNLTNLLPNQTYQFRTFCTSGGNTIYGTINNFTTLSINTTTLAATNITQTKATLNGTVTFGDATITKGFEYKLSTDANFTQVNVSASNTDIVCNLSNLQPNKNYQFRTFYTLGNNTTYGTILSFNTLSINTTTSSATNTTQTKATLNGEVAFGDATTGTKGFEYKLSTESNFTKANVSGNSSNITYNLTDLLPSSTYQFRAFYTLGGEPFYGAVNSFTTLSINTTTLVVTNITRSTATLNGETSFGDATVIEQGFILEKPTENDTISVNNTSATLTYTTTNLSYATAFSYKTYCTTAGGTVYGEVQHFNTLAFNTDNNGNHLIENKEDLILLANLVNSGNSFNGQTFKLKNDITLPIAPNNILSIGNYQNGTPFSGTFHGNGKRIYNVYIDEPNTPYQGFFGYTKDAYLYEVGLVNITASGRNYTGGMVAYAENTRINDSYVSGGTLFALSYCGGLVGYQTPGTNSIITGCYNTCTVSGNTYVGGLLGYSDQGTVRNSYAAALVTGLGDGVGAIIGGAQDVLSYNCYFNDSITGQPFAIGENKISMRSASSEGNMSSNDMRMQAFVNTLNQGLVTPVWKSDYQEAVNNGFPILMWQSNQVSGVEEIKTRNNLTLYPNPAKDYLFIQSEAPVEKIEIYSQSGVCVLTNNNPTEVLDISDLSNGFYFVRIYVNGIPANKKIIVRK